jgi:penicillin-binding protein 1A
MPEPPPLRADPQERPRVGKRPIRRPPRRPPTPRRHRSWLTILALVLLWGLILGGGVIGYFALTLPDTSRLAVAERRPSLTILAADGSVIATYGDLFGRPLTLRQMSPYLPEAVIATEDRRFYSNFGIDPIGMLRAAIADLRAGRIVEGGSTITQQLAKILFLTPERSIGRKIRETLLALWLDHRFTKNQILEIYLNRVYLGAGAYGVDAAAHRYFGQSAADLDLYESAVIAGLLKAPSRYSPARDRAAAAARAAQVLDNMVEAGFITRAAAEAAERHGADWAGAGHAGSRYFADWIADQVHDFAGPADRDLIVETTLDPRQQQAAEAAIGDVLARYGARDRVSQGALVSLAPDGAVRAMVGGRDYAQSQFNRATEAERQPGSAFKPFVYLAGLEAGLRPSDVFDDAPIRVGDWRPHDYGRRYQGEMTLAHALADSINTVAVRVAERAGIGHVIAVASRLGITSTLPRDASIALGTADLNLLELTAAYAPFANGGGGVIPYGIREIRDRAGHVVYRRQGSGPGPVVAPAFVGMMNDMLEGVIRDGTARAAALPRPAAGKTGTTQDYRDAWFIGYTANLVTGVWFGNDNDAPMRQVVGGSLPAMAWRNFMLTATRGMPVQPLPDIGGGDTPSAPTAAVEQSPFARLLGWLVGLRQGPPAPPRFPDPPAQN